MDEFIAVLALAIGIPAAVVSFLQIVDRLKSRRHKKSLRNKKREH